jgi:hypothetical protein
MFEQASLTVYDPAYANALLHCLETADTFEAALSQIQAQGLEAIAISSAQ